LSKFELLVEFEPLNDFLKLMDLPPLQQFITDGDNNHFNVDNVRKICGSLLTASELIVVGVYDQLAKMTSNVLGSQAYILDLFPRLAQQYSKEDNGNLVALVAMNFPDSIARTGNICTC